MLYPNLSADAVRTKIFYASQKSVSPCAPRACIGRCLSYCIRTARFSDAEVQLLEELSAFFWCRRRSRVYNWGPGQPYTSIHITYKDSRS
jgi:hypothetical protein